MRQLVLGDYTQKDLTDKVNTVGDVTRLQTAVKDNLVNAINISVINYKRKGPPKNNINPTINFAVYLDTDTGNFWICTDKTANKNIWVSPKEGFSGATPPQPTVGSSGFGAGICPQELAKKLGMSPMDGTFTPGHMNYGNYQDSRGSVLVWIPKMYIKTSHNAAVPYLGCKVELSYTKASGFWCHRAFINNGKEVDGFFIDKYLNSNQGGVASSVRSAKPVHWANTDIAAGNLIGVTEKWLLGNEQNPNESGRGTKSKHYASGNFELAKVRGPNYHVMTLFEYNYLILLSKFIYQKAYEANDFSKIGWASSRTSRYNFIQGMNTMQTFNTAVNAVHALDYKNKAYTHTNGRVLYCTGDVSDANLGKISHNGQSNGVIDLVGGLWAWAPGHIYMYRDSANWFGVLKESTNINSITLNNILDKSLYDEITMPTEFMNFINQSKDTALHYLVGNNSLYRNNPTRTTNDYKLDSCGIPNFNTLRTSPVEENMRQTFVWRGNPSYNFAVTLAFCGSCFRDSYYSSLHWTRDYSLVNGGLRCAVLPD